MNQIVITFWCSLELEMQSCVQRRLGNRNPATNKQGLVYAAIFTDEGAHASAGI